MAGIDLVVPASAYGPLGGAVAIDDLAGDLVSGRGLPAARLEVEVADLASCPVFDFHETVVVDRGVSGDDADHRRSDLLPGIQLLSASNRAQLKEPGTEEVDVEGLAVELGLERGLAL